MAMWNPWRGCKKCSDGCKYCYIHKGDFKRNINTNDIIKTKDFSKPIEKLKNGSYKIKSGTVYVCFSSDFLIEEADLWRNECWKMIKERDDLNFLFLTKRIDRFLKCIPDDWNDGYENVIVCCTIENQKNADYKLSIFKDLPIKHKCITAQPLIENIDIEKYLDDIELVVVGGESDYNARPFNYEWALNIREQCIRKKVNFEFRQCGTHFIKDNISYTLQTKDLCKQARLANIDYHIKEKYSTKNERPKLDTNLDSKTFKSYYYLKEELISFCKENSLQTTGGKIELTERIAHYLDTKERITNTRISKKAVIINNISLDTIIEENFVCSQKHRAFYKENIGKTFSFNTIFQKWLKNNSGKTYKESIEAYYQILEDKKKNKTIIDKQFEYNTYIRDFFNDNKDKNLDQAIKCWKYKKSLKGHNKYEKEDLEVLKSN